MTANYLNVLNTRPQPMGAELETVFATNGINSQAFPVIENLMVPEGYSRLISSLNDDSGVWVFISKSAVQFFQCHLEAQNIECFSPAKAVIAVGKTTKQALLDINPQLNVLTPKQATSESLLIMPELLNAEQVNLVKGVGGRGLIQSTLQQHSVKVIELDLYHRQSVQYPQAIVQLWQSADVVLATSVDISKAILANISNQLPNEQIHNFLQSKHWIVLSERIKQFLIEQNVSAQHIHITERSDNQAIVDIIINLTK